VLIPIMADQLAGFLPPEGEKALGDATFEQIRTALDETGSGLRVCEAPAGRKALDRMTQRLAKHATFPFELTVNVLDHDMVNAFALPGGHIILFEGLIRAAGDPDEVAAVLAHEMGHVAARDATRGALRSAGSIGVLGLLFGDFAGGTLALFLAEQLVEARYSQEAELAADSYAIALAAEAGIAPGGMGRFFERLRDDGGDVPEILAHFSSHPQLTARIEAAAAQEPDDRDRTSPSLASADWQDLRAICG